MENPFREAYVTKVVLDDPSEHEAAELLYVTTVVFNDLQKDIYRIRKGGFSEGFHPQIATDVSENLNFIEFSSDYAAVERVKSQKKCYGITRVMIPSYAKKHRLLYEGELKTLKKYFMEKELSKNGGSSVLEDLSPSEAELEAAGMLCVTTVVSDDSVKRKFRRGKTSFSMEFYPEIATVVTKIIDENEFPSEFAAAWRVVNLKSICSESVYVARAVNAKKHRILLEEEVIFTLQSWINEMEKKLINTDVFWFDLIHKDLFKNFREFGLCLVHIHENGSIFEGSMADVIKTPTNVKLCKARKIKNARELDLRKRTDLKKFIEFFLTCLYKPANVSNQWAISSRIFQGQTIGI